MVFEHAISHGIAISNPARQISRERVNTAEQIVPTREQVTRLVGHLRKKRRTADAANMVELICYTGLRQHEAAQLRWDEIDGERGLVKVTGGPRGTKNRLVRFVPMNAACRELLARIPRFQARVLGTGDCRMSVGRACALLGLPHFTHHSFRHFYASDAIERGVNVRTLAQWLGHRDGGMLLLKTYSHVWEAQEQEAAAKMTFSAVSGP
jgi:integrase